MRPICAVLEKPAGRARVPGISADSRENRLGNEIRIIRYIATIQKGPPGDAGQPIVHAVQDPAALAVGNYWSLVAEARDDRCEQRVQLGLEAGQAGDDANADNSSDEAVFDCRGARLVFSEIKDLLHSALSQVVSCLTSSPQRLVVVRCLDQNALQALLLN